MKDEGRGKQKTEIINKIIKRLKKRLKKKKIKFKIELIDQERGRE